VEHFRPKTRVSTTGGIEYWYWFLAFNPINYRLSSQISNRLTRKSVLGATGGKGNKFPLMPDSPRATYMAGLGSEHLSFLIRATNRMLNCSNSSPMAGLS